MEMDFERPLAKDAPKATVGAPKLGRSKSDLAMVLEEIRANQAEQAETLANLQRSLRAMRWQK